MRSRITLRSVVVVAVILAIAVVIMNGSRRPSGCPDLAELPRLNVEPAARDVATFIACQ